MEQPKIRIGISRCLLGERVRYDGGHKRDTYLVSVLGKYFEWITVCPEVEIGLGIPRESIHLVETDDGIRLRSVRSGNDVTDKMRAYASIKVKELRRLNLRGFVLKKDSPSCGMERVNIHIRAGVLKKNGRGLFAETLLHSLPLIPVEEEGRLNDLKIRENFVERIFAYDRWTKFSRSRPAPQKLIEFHTRHKMTILSHTTVLYRELGQIVAQAAKTGWKDLLNRYGVCFMNALRQNATPRKHSNCLYHLMGHLKHQLSPGDKVELVECIEQYRQEKIPLIVPMTLLKHHFRRNPVPWVMQQTYLDPYPAELMLRNHV